MNQSEGSTSSRNRAGPSEGKPWPLITIIGMVAFVLLSGYVLSPKTEGQRLAWVNLLGTTNMGTLMDSPTEVLAGQMVDTEGNYWIGLEDNTWKLLVLNEGFCGELCTNRLLELHAMRIRLNRDASRLTVGLLATQPQVLPEVVSELHDINNLYIKDSSLLAELGETNIPNLSDGPVVLMMNPINVFMMSYDLNNTAVEMLEDFEHLLDLAH